MQPPPSAAFFSPFPRAIPSEGYPWGFDEDGWLSWIRDNREHWGERDSIAALGLFIFRMIGRFLLPLVALVLLLAGEVRGSVALGGGSRS